MNRVVVTAWRDTLVATLPSDLDAAVYAELSDGLTHRVRAARARAVVLDASAVDVMDTEDWRRLRGVLATSALLGARGALVGLRPGIVAALVACGADTEGVLAFRGVEDAVVALGVAE